jgi:hypothetical protein
MRLLRPRIIASMLAAGAVWLAAAPRAEAGLQLKMTDVNTGDVKVLTAAPGAATISFNDTFGNFNVNISVSTTSPGTGLTGSRVSDLTTTTRNTSGVSDTIIYEVQSDGFTLPYTPVIVKNTLGASEISAPGASGTFTSYLGALYDSSGNAIANPNATPSVAIGYDDYDPSTDSWPGKGSVARFDYAGSSFTLSNRLAVTMDGGSYASFTGTTAAVAPEPASLAMAGTAMAMSLGAWARRRRSKPVA